jgi:hypothetical protein
MTLQTPDDQPQKAADLLAKAQETRAAAEIMTDLETRHSLSNISRAYEYLAKWVQIRSKKRSADR